MGVAPTPAACTHLAPRWTRTTAVRRMLNGILYLNKTGCQWRLVPKEFGHWSTIYGYCKRWRRDGVWARLMETLRQWERRCLGRQPEPSAGSI